MFKFLLASFLISGLAFAQAGTESSTEKLSQIQTNQEHSGFVAEFVYANLSDSTKNVGKNVTFNVPMAAMASYTSNTQTVNNGSSAGLFVGYRSFAAEKFGWDVGLMSVQNLIDSENTSYILSLPLNLNYSLNSKISFYAGANLGIEYAPWLVTPGVSVLQSLPNLGGQAGVQYHYKNLNLSAGYQVYRWDTEYYSQQSPAPGVIASADIKVAYQLGGFVSQVGYSF